MTVAVAATLGVHLAECLQFHGLMRAEADLVAADVDKRCRWFSSLSWAGRHVVSAAFLEETANYAPAHVSWQTRAAASVIARSSVIERFHTDYLLDDVAVRSATTLAALLLDETLLVAPGESGGHLACLAGRYPVAWSALDALRRSFASGRRTLFAVPADWRPTPLPTHRRLVYAPVNDTGQSIYSGIESRFDARFVDYVRRCQGEPLILASLSRISRNVEKIMASLEMVLSRRMPVVTTNATIHPDGWIETRSGALVPPDSFSAPQAILSDTDGFSEPQQEFRDSLRKLDRRQSVRVAAA